METAKGQLENWAEMLRIKLKSTEQMKNNLFSTNSRISSLGGAYISSYSSVRPSLILNTSTTINELIKEDEKEI